MIAIHTLGSPLIVCDWWVQNEGLLTQMILIHSSDKSHRARSDTQHGTRSGCCTFAFWPTSPGAHNRGAAGRLHMGTSPTTEVHGYHRYAVLGLSITPASLTTTPICFSAFPAHFFVSTSVASRSLNNIVSRLHRIGFPFLYGIEIHALLTSSPTTAAGVRRARDRRLKGLRLGC